MYRHSNTRGEFCIHWPSTWAMCQPAISCMITDEADRFSNLMHAYCVLNALQTRLARTIRLAQGTDDAPVQHYQAAQVSSSTSGLSCRQKDFNFWALTDSKQLYVNMQTPDHHCKLFMSPWAGAQGCMIFWACQKNTHMTVRRGDRGARERTPHAPAKS